MNNTFIFMFLSLFLIKNVLAKADNRFPIENKKILVVYYSYSGNTERVAKAIHEKVGGNIFKIKTEGIYPDNYEEMTGQAKIEIENGFRPKLTNYVDDIKNYDIIFLGSPNWWGTITPQVSSFINEHDLSGKRIIPFITHGGGGLQRTVSDMIKQCKGCNIDKDVLSVYGGDNTYNIDNWLENIKDLKNINR